MNLGDTPKSSARLLSRMAILKPYRPRSTSAARDPFRKQHQSELGVAFQRQAERLGVMPQSGGKEIARHQQRAHELIRPPLAKVPLTSLAERGAQVLLADGHPSEDPVDRFIGKAEQAGLARHRPPARYVEDGMAEFVRQGAQQQAIVIAGQVGVNRDQGRIRHPAVIILAHPQHRLAPLIRHRIIGRPADIEPDVVRPDRLDRQQRIAGEAISVGGGKQLTADMPGDAAHLIVVDIQGLAGSSLMPVANIHLFQRHSVFVLPLFVRPVGMHRGGDVTLHIRRKPAGLMNA